MRLKIFIFYCIVNCFICTSFSQILEVGNPLCFSWWNGGCVEAIAVHNGALYVTGSIDSAENCTISIRNVAKWNGSTWSALGLGAYGTSHGYDFCSYNGSLVLAGLSGGILEPGGTNIPFTNTFACWDGTAWSALSTDTFSSTSIYVVEVFNGEMYAGGTFTRINGNWVNRIAKWNGSSWSDVGGGVTGFGIVKSMSVHNGKLFIAGDFSTAGGNPAHNIACWNGSTWDSLGSGLETIAYELISDSTNDVIYAIGPFTIAGNIYCNGFAKWNGTNWEVPDTTNYGWLSSGEMYHGDLYIGAANQLLKWNGISMQIICTTNGAIMSLKEFNDTLFIGGYFDTINGNPHKYIAKYFSTDLSSINKTSIVPALNIYPNPVFKYTSEITFTYSTLSEPGEISIFNVDGKKVASYTLPQWSSIQRVKLPELAGGIYMANLSTGSKTANVKFVIQ